MSEIAIAHQTALAQPITMQSSRASVTDLLNLYSDLDPNPTEFDAEPLDPLLAPKRSAESLEVEQLHETVRELELENRLLRGEKTNSAR